MKTDFRPCPVCGSKEFKEVYNREHVVFDGHPLAGTYLAGSCVRCGMIFNRHGAAAEDFETYYRKFSKYSPKDIFQNPYYEAIADAVAGIVSNRAVRIIDLGAGGGELLATLQRRGYHNLEGLEPSPECVAYIRKVLKIPCRAGSIISLDGLSGQWDLLLSTGVFEHLLNPSQAVREFSHLVAPGGCAFVLVPDLERYVECLSTPFQDFSVEHINHFTTASLSGLFSRHGWFTKQSGKITRTVTPTCSYPDLWCAFTPDEKAQIPETPDNAGVRCLQKYVVASEYLLACIRRHLEQALPPGRFVMWGAGHTASLLLSDGLLQNRELVLVIDGNTSYEGQLLCGTQILSPRQPEVASVLADTEMPIFVATIRESTAIESNIRNLGYMNPIICPLPGTHIDIA